MRRSLSIAVLACCVLLVVAAVPIPVSAHSNHLTATTQVASDGTVVVETVYVSQPAHLVVHADDDGEMGEALGSRTLSPNGFERNVEVDLDADAWAEWGENRTVWVALHADDGDGEYDSDDRVFTPFNRPAAHRIGVGKGDAAHVTGRSYLGQETGGPSISVDRATLPEDGLLVVRDNETDAVVGTSALSAGTHDDLTVDLNRSYYDAQSGSFTVRAQLYHDDGDGTLGDGDQPYLAGEQPVETTLPVSVGEGGANGSGGPAVNTPTQPVINTPVETPTGGSGATGGATTDDTGGTGAGFGVGVALVVFAATLSLVWFVSRNGR